MTAADPRSRRASRRTPVLLLLALTAHLTATAPAHAQHALVLSGGGARGLAHAGAIVALEELGYQPAPVVGASMGAIVGALYAAGYSATEIRTIIRDENWLERFAATPVLFGPMRDPRRPLLTLGISSGRFYGGFIAGSGINQRLVELLFDAGVRARNDFDALPLPYRAVTADLSTGEEVVLGSGDLPRAVRASMAVPGVFAPVMWQGRVLVDGGVANNLPVSVARALTDRPVIAIDVLRPREEITERGVLDLGVRALRLLIENARPDSNSTADILVLPELRPGLSETYFPANASDVLDIGYDAIIAQVPRVAQQPVQRHAPRPPPERVGALAVEGGDAAFGRLIRRIMGGAVREYDAADIAARTSALYMTGLFEAVWPRLDFDADSLAPTLVIDITPVASTSVAGAVRWDNDVGAGAWAALRQRISLITPVDVRLAGAANELGQSASLDGSFFSALIPGVLWSGGVHAQERRLRVIASDTVADLLDSRRAGAWVGGELRGPIRDWYFSVFGIADRLRGPGTPSAWAIGPAVRITRAPAPDRVVGIDPLLEAEVRGGDIEYQRVRVRGSATVPIRFARTAVLAEAATASVRTPADVLPHAYRDIAPWLREGDLRGRHSAAVGVDGAVPTILNGYLRLRLRAFAMADDIDVFQERAAWWLGGEAGAVWPTVVGPITIGVAAGEHAHWRLNLGIGANF